MRRPGLLARVAATMPAFWTGRATIQERVTALDSYGQPADLWQDVDGLVDLPCIVGSVASAQAAEQRRENVTVTDAGRYVLLAGRYDAITTAHRALVDGVAYDIVAVETEPTGALTRLHVRRVTI